MTSATRTMILAALPKAPEGKEWKQYAPDEVMGEGQFISLSGDGRRIVANQPNNGVIGHTVSSLLAPYQSSWHLVDVARKVSPKPANHIVPKGYVYLGKGGEFKVGSEETMFGYALWEHDRFDGSRSCSPSNWIAQSVPDDLYYYAPVDSKLALLNGLTLKAKKTTLRDENARLTKEVAALKEELAKAKADIDYRISRERDTRELATKIINRLS